MIFLLKIALTNQGRELAPFKIYKVVKNFYDDTLCVGWSQDSEFVAIGSRDLTVKVVSIHHKKSQYYFNLASHSDALISCFFTSTSQTDLNICSLSKNGQLFVWESSMSKDQLENNELSSNKLLYRKKATHYLNDNLKVSRRNFVTAADYNSKVKLLVIGFSTGAFLLHEIPEFNLIHCLEMEKLGNIDSLTINPSGNWIAIASGVKSLNYNDLEFEAEKTSQSQLIVWDWQSESFVYNQTGTGIGYTHITECVAYSEDGSTLASGGSDGKVKVWNTFTGNCIITFNEQHKAAVTGIEYQPSSGGKVIISASLDGTIRAFDLHRFKNFRTLTTSSETLSAQFISLAVDTVSSDFIAAGAQNLFEIFLWSLKTGRFLEALTGHQAPVSGLKFSPSNNILVSCSWDQTVRTWSLFEGSKCTREIINVGSDATSIAFRPDGNQFAVSTINGNISFFDPNTGEMNGVAIEGSKDLGFSQTSYELARTKDTFFTTLYYSSDGLYIIGGGKSRYICIYHTFEKILIKKFALSRNQSMEGLFDFISDRKKAEFGFNQDLIKSRKESEYSAVKLPGVRTGDFGDRSANPIIAVNSIRFSPTMRCFTAATTEGILIYSLDSVSIFNPFELESDIDPSTIESCLESKQYNEALMQALKLNDDQLLTKVIESVPQEDIQFVAQTLPINYVQKCIKFIATSLETTRHIEFYLFWIQVILNKFGVSMKANYSASSELMAILRLLQRNLGSKFEKLNKIGNFNRYRLKFIQVLGDKKEDMEVDSA